MKIKRKVSKETRPAPAPAGRAMAAPAMPRAQQHPAAGRKSVAQTITLETAPYAAWKEWHGARERGDWDFVYDLAADGSPLRAQFGDRGEFGEICRRKLRPMPGTRPATIARIRLQGHDEAFVFQAVDYEERGMRNYTVERFWMLRGSDGWRVWRIDEQSKPKDQGFNTIDNASFPAVEVPASILEVSGPRELARLDERKRLVEAFDAKREAEKGAPPTATELEA